MRIVKALIEGVKLAVLFSAIALVVWRMPEHEPNQIDQDETEVVTVDG